MRPRTLPSTFEALWTPVGTTATNRSPKRRRTARCRRKHRPIPDASPPRKRAMASTTIATVKSTTASRRFHVQVEDFVTVWEVARARVRRGVKSAYRAANVSALSPIVFIGAFRRAPPTAGASDRVGNSGRLRHATAPPARMAPPASSSSAASTTAIAASTPTISTVTAIAVMFSAHAAE